MNSVRFDGPHPLELRPEAQSQEEVGVSAELSLELGLIEPIRAPLQELLKTPPSVTNCWIDVKYYHDS